MPSERRRPVDPSLRKPAQALAAVGDGAREGRQPEEALAEDLGLGDGGHRGVDAEEDVHDVLLLEVGEPAIYGVVMGW